MLFRSQLTDADHALQLWSELWDARMENILDVQQEIAEAVVTELLGREVTEADVAQHMEIESGDEAYQHLLRGRHALTTGTRASLAQAQMGLAEMGARPRAETLPQVRSHLDEALRLAPDMPEAHAALALLLTAVEWDWDGV
mgnify:CR=1 FL=1